MILAETIEEKRKVLETRRADLNKHLHNIEDVLDEPAPKDIEDAATERQGDEVLEALGRAELQELQQIAAALTRMDEGSYGFCMRCGEEISQARLDLLPATPLCRNCAA